jgi:hypothetical protein
MNYMDHFVQYHNPDLMGGPYKPSQKEFAIFTDRLFTMLQGATVWLVTGENRPRRYYLCSTFCVEKVGHENIGRFHYRVSGAVGRNFDPFIEIGELQWFSELRKATGNFAWFQHIRSQVIIRGLEKITASLLTR